MFAMSRPPQRVGRPAKHAPDRCGCNRLPALDQAKQREAGLRLTLELAQSPQIGQYVERFVAPSEDDLASEAALQDYVRRNVNTYHHPVGTARMGPEGDAGAVVDQYCRVRGTENLYVADASIMPNLGSGNTNAPTIMSAEKGADMIKADAHASPADLKFLHHLPQARSGTSNR